MEAGNNDLVAAEGLHWDGSLTNMYIRSALSGEAATYKIAERFY